MRRPRSPAATRSRATAASSRAIRSRGAEAIIATVERSDPPLRLPLGNVAYDVIGAEIEALRKEHASVEAVARGADYPKGS